ncbi:MAG: lipid-A-disaccharide synthase [Candidatus Omnitrophica bacterium]|nr:lipid-A-disaccharide synthase [Candidatus Omnitrophota bacterium]
MEKINPAPRPKGHFNCAQHPCSKERDFTRGGVNKVLIVAGEASGDLHASNLVKAIKNIRPQIEFSGLGGEKLKEAGVDLYFNMVELAVVGFLEVLKNLTKFRKIFAGILKEVDRVKPDLAILVDYPGFNLRLAEKLNKRRIPIIYYISPQVWAWGANRIKTIKKVISRMLVVFEFEEDLYKKNAVPVSFVGHPLLDVVKTDIAKEELFRSLGLNVNNFTFALLPGSREKEVTSLLPIMLETAGLLYEYLGNNIQFLVLRSASVKEEIFNKILKRYSFPVQIVSNLTYNGLAASNFALVASGTATLETAILAKPMVILYKVSFLTWAYLKLIIKIPYIGLVNVVRKEKFIAEFIQYDARPKKIADYIARTIKDNTEMTRIKDGLSDLTSKLGEKGASSRAAQIVVEILDKTKPQPKP